MSTNWITTPWGRYQVLEEGEGFLFKLLEINPGHATSLQRHAHRTEHWTLVCGDGYIYKGDKTHHVVPGEQFTISPGEPHRLECLSTSQDPLTVYETWEGDILDENDIERISDNYGRV